MALKTLQDMGMGNIAEMTGGSAAWRDPDGPVEQRGLTVGHVQ